ncbi:TetR/AcrR family transcriptional regulator [Anaerocolumna sp. MB42-C2]|uniref:TetR/AcrR family transcriptional regulator n=1 Tax=Anaerocolumna sp. MB42-C2 TaxID=3070997 RepID=UPI0027E157AB|nr:TetR/AcrR family transcriptional regulator [Anaerocolumna sp. MB42-C2]WMJ90090.1 TetR/AcrR family transcriptional regulator [Anaerocolumna sp. MB42-C2]
MNEPNARDRILKAAIKVFAEKSYEGSRMDEIAREAYVPKSLIYYHFKSKAEILEVLTSKFINEYADLISEKTKETHQEKAEKLADRIKNEYYEFGRRNADLVRVIFIDSLKKSKDKPVLFKMLDVLITQEARDSKEGDLDIQERRVTEFFTSFITNYAYICFNESWIKYYGIEKEQFDRLFLKVYEDTHGNYHKNHK